MKINFNLELLEREKEVRRLIELLNESKLNFIIVGGYAVSTYKKRFSVDLDIIIEQRDLPKFEKLLLKEGYLASYQKEIALLYGENFKRFRKKMNNLPVDVDLLINGLASRTTGASWSFDFIVKNSQKRMLDSIEYLIPIKELLIAMKVHSGRLSDVRDIVALMPCDKDKLKGYLLRGNLSKLKDTIKKELLFIEKSQFDDSFKGIFGILAYNLKDVEFARKLFIDLISEIK